MCEKEKLELAGEIYDITPSFHKLKKENCINIMVKTFSKKELERMSKLSSSKNKEKDTAKFEEKNSKPIPMPISIDNDNSGVINLLIKTGFIKIEGIDKFINSLVKAGLTEFTNQFIPPVFNLLNYSSSK